MLAGAVVEAFVRLHEKGLIYQGALVNLRTIFYLLCNKFAYYTLNTSFQLCNLIMTNIYYNIHIFWILLLHLYWLIGNMIIVASGEKFPNDQCHLVLFFWVKHRDVHAITWLVELGLTIHIFIKCRGLSLLG